MKLKVSQKIGTKLVILFLIVALIPLTCLSIINYYYTQKSIEADTKANMLSTVKLTTEALDNWITEKVMVVEGISTNDIFQSGNKDGVMDFLMSEAKSTPYAEVLLWADSSGQGVNSLGAKPDISDREYFKAAMQGKTFISDLTVSKTTGNKVIFIAFPIKTAKGNSVLAMSLKSDTLESLTRESVFGQSGYTYLIDNSGTVIAHPDPSQILNLNITQTDSDSINIVGKKILERKMGAMSIPIRVSRN